MHGRTIQTSMPFYVSSALLRPGLSDFAVAFGAFREHYGVRNFVDLQLRFGQTVEQGGRANVIADLSGGHEEADRTNERRHRS